MLNTPKGKPSVNCNAYIKKIILFEFIKCFVLPYNKNEEPGSPVVAQLLDFRNLIVKQK